MGGMLRDGKNSDRGQNGLINGGCSCCNSAADHRRARKSVKQAEKKQWKKDADDEVVD